MKFTLLCILMMTCQNVFSKELTCLQEKGHYSNDLYIQAYVKAKITTINSEEYLLSNLYIHYKLITDFESNYIWSEGMVNEVNLTNKEGYSPRVYKEHIKFETYADGSGRTSGYGYLDLILPIQKIDSQTQENFTAFLIMTYIDDHYGGTAKLNCTIKN